MFSVILTNINLRNSSRSETLDIIYKEDSYKIIGCCIEVYNILGKGFNEIIYKDALACEFSNRSISFEREKEFSIRYKDIVLPHKYFADFIVYEKIILEAKAIERLTPNHIKQCLNYLAASKMKLSLLVNFGEDSLKYQRVVL
jgi:GxxExxY protein